MGQIHYTFDPTKQNEIYDLFNFLHRLYPEITDNPMKIGAPSISDTEKDREICELNNKEKNYQMKYEDNSKIIIDLNQKLQEVEDRNKINEQDKESLSKQIEEINAEKESLIRQHAEKETKLQNDFETEKRRIEQEHQTEVQKLNKEIELLKKKLNHYEPTLNGEHSSDKKFNVEGQNLRETYDENAPFIGKVGLEGQTIFNFNLDKGPHKYYSQNPQELKNYCEIIESMDGANHIGLGEWGQGTLYNGGLLVVAKKAKIKLVRE